MAASRRRVSLAPRPQGMSPRSAPASSSIAEFPGVAGAGDEAADPPQVHIPDKAVVLLGQDGLVQQPEQDLLGLRPLEGHLGHPSGDVLHLARAEQMLPHPAGVLILVCGVDHHQIGGVVHLVDDQIVHTPPLVVAHGGIAHLSVVHAGKIIGKQVDEVAERVRPGEYELPHVADVEEPGSRAHRHMLGDHARRVLDGQQVAGKGDDLAARRGVLCVERGFLFHLYHHPF